MEQTLRKRQATAPYRRAGPGKKRKLITCAIGNEYTFIDELLATIITTLYFFGTEGWRKDWRTERSKGSTTSSSSGSTSFRSSRWLRTSLHCLAEPVIYVEKVNDLRNAVRDAVAHAFFPKNLRGPRTTYQDLDILRI
jgi:hypothetical protein